MPLAGSLYRTLVVPSVAANNRGFDTDYINAQRNASRLASVLTRFLPNPT